MRLNQTIHYQKVGIYNSTDYSLLSLIDDFLEKDYEYGLVKNRFGDIIGYFTSKQLLQYCRKVGFEHVEDIETLSLFIKMLNKDFKIIEEHKATQISLTSSHELYVVKKDIEIIGVIDKEKYMDSVVETQQYELHHFKTMFNAVPSGIIAVNIEGIITMMNPAAERLGAVRKEDALGQFITDVFPPDGLLRVLQTGQGHVEKYKVRKWWYVSYREPIYDGKRLVGAVGVFNDISKIEMLSTELESVKQLVKENEALMDHSDHGIAIIDVQGNILRQNRQFHQIYLAIINEMKQRMQLFQAIQDVINKQLLRFDLEIKIGKGNIYHFQFSSLIEDGCLRSIITRVIDITMAKEKEIITQQIHETHRSLFGIKSENRFIAEGEEMKELTKKALKAAKVSAPILIKGKFGTGRSAVAQQIVLESDRRNAPFIEIDCFGKGYNELYRLFHSKDLASLHLLQAAAGGTLYFKNIDFLPHSLQEQLANVLAEQSDVKAIKQNLKIYDVRFIASISTDLSFDGANVFCERLYYLLNAITLQLPPIENRERDIRCIIESFIEKLEQKFDLRIHITNEAINYLVKRRSSGNLREIYELLERYIVNFPQNIIDQDQLVLFTANQETVLQKLVNVNQVIPLKQAVVEVEKELIQLVGSQNISYRKMAKILEVNPSTIVRKVKNLTGDDSAIHIHE